MEGLSEVEIGSRKARTLVKVLALARASPVSVPALADILWADDARPARPTEQVGVLVSRLRRVLGAGRLTRSEGGFALHVDWLDVDELSALVEDAAGALQAGRLGAARAASTAALELARGVLLPDDEGEWLEAERAASSAVTARARGVAAEAALIAGDHLAAELAAEAALAHDPYDEATLRVLMRAQVAGARPASALASYARARERLAEHLGVSPSPETEALHTKVLTGAADIVPIPTRARSELIGRDEELQVLEKQLQQARGRVRLVLVVGEAGVGKSAVVQAFVERASVAGARVITASADELGRDLPLQPIIDALAHDGALAQFGPSDRLTAGSRLDTRADRFRWFGAVLERLMAAPAPAGLVVDDVQWADSATREWLSWVQGQDGALLVIAITRSGDTIASAHEVALGPLSQEAVGTLIGSSDPSRTASVHSRSGGNPLFALALAGAPDDALPESVQQVVASTLARLDPLDVELLRAVAVLDASLDVDLVAGVLRQPAIELIGRLERAAGVGLLVERGTGYEFRHALMREALAESTGTARAALLHREAARLLDDRPARDPLAVAVHAGLGGASEIAARAYREAAMVSFGRADLAAAETQIRASLDAAESAETHRALALVLMAGRRMDEAAAAAERAMALDGSAEALETAGWIDYYRRRYDRARRFADEAVARAAPGSAVRASALALGGRIRHGIGDTSVAGERLVEALDGPPAVRGVAEVWLGHVRLHEGRPDDALELVEHALLDPDHIAHPFAPLHGRFARVMALGQLGRLGDAMNACDDLREATRRAGTPGTRFVAVELNVRSWLLRGAGRSAEAIDLNRSAIEHNGAVDGSGPFSDALAEAYWVAWLDLADGYLAGGDASSAAALLQTLNAIDTWDGTMAWHQRHRLGLIRSRIARAGGDDSAAAQLACDVVTSAAALGTARYEALAHVQLALAGGDRNTDRVARSVGVLRRCAALELPALLEELDQFGLAG